MTEQRLTFRTPNAGEEANLRQLLLSAWQLLERSREGLAPEADPQHLTIFVTATQMIAGSIPIDQAQKERYVQAVRVAQSRLDPPPIAIISTTAAYITTRTPQGDVRVEVMLYRLETRDGFGGMLISPITRRPGSAPGFGEPMVEIYDSSNVDSGNMCGYFAAPEPGSTSQ